MVSWSAEQDLKIMMWLLANFSGKVDHQAIADHIGEGCTKKAVSERILRLKKRAAGCITPISSPTKRKINSSTALHDDMDRSLSKRAARCSPIKSTPIQRQNSSDCTDSDEVAAKSSVKKVVSDFDDSD